MDRSRPDSLRALDDALRAMGVDPTLPWLPETMQQDLFIAAACTRDPREDRNQAADATDCP
jgi:hypothetical protein